MSSYHPSGSHGSRSRRRLPRSVAATASSLALVVSCYDYSPTTEIPPLPSGSQGAEAGADASLEVAQVVEACVECVSPASGPCTASYAACLATPRCEALFLCGVKEGCFAPDANKVSCLTKCATAAQVTGLSDPAVNAFLDLDKCVGASCGAACDGKP